VSEGAVSTLYASVTEFSGGAQCCAAPKRCGSEL
jgi:hypothetical protein